MLSPFTTAQFEAKEMFCKADKPQLALAVAEYSRKTSKDAVVDSTPLTEQYVIDGGSLIHHLPWKKVDSYGVIAQNYAGVYHAPLRKSNCSF